MHGGVSVLMDIVKSGMDPGGVVPLTAVLGGIKARSLGPLLIG
jgi:hypothetical protein